MRDEYIASHKKADQEKYYNGPERRMIEPI